MIDNKEYLQDLIYFCTTPNGLEQRKQKSRSTNNLTRHMQELERQKSTLAIKEHYVSNIEKCRAFVNTIPIVHNTSLDCLLSIIKCGFLLPALLADEANVNFNWRIIPNRNIEHTSAYVYASPGKGDWLYGLYEIHLKREVENTIGSYFIPRAELKLSSECIKENLIDLSLWRQYLAEVLAVCHYDVEDFMHKSIQEKPELLILGRIPIELIEKIVCANQNAYKKLLVYIESECMDKADKLDKIEITYIGKEAI